MPSYRFATRSTTPGEYRLAAGTMDLLVAAADVREDVDRGDGTLGTMAGYAAGYAAGLTAGAEAQLVLDQLAVEAAKADIVETRTILTVRGTLSTQAIYDAGYAAALAEIAPDTTITAATPRAIRELQRLMAMSATWRTKVNQATVVGAKLKLYLLENEKVAADFKADRPFCLIYPADTSWHKESGGSGSAFGGSGHLVVQFVDNAAHPGREQGARESSGMEFMEWTQGIIEDVLALAGTGDYLQIRDVKQNLTTDGPFRNQTADEASAGSFWWAQFHVYWGAAG
jgi:hypothetical protein